MAQIRLTVAARRDLMDIWIGLAGDNGVAADRLLGRLEVRINALLHHRELGTPRPNIAPEARVLVERPYLILYRIAPASVQIVRVLHGARQIDEALFDESGG